MKVIVAGSRTIRDYDVVSSAIVQSGFKVSEIVSGGATGVDSLGGKWANFHEIPVKAFIAQWGALGKKAGILRNTEMANYAEALVAIWDGYSSGTANMIEQALRRKLKLYVVTVSLKPP